MKNKKAGRNNSPHTSIFWGKCDRGFRIVVQEKSLLDKFDF
ncbi:hypothetical protein [Porphyromonas circumdentaria]|nr:hypothetical protein [Porphyromonas circumdentaria]MBB6275420.1 hypothetical protein [Porphyromonas circumdentaria]MDO4722116.1 hypothetical protein [Porphyromonas circumdentaria]